VKILFLDTHSDIRGPLPKILPVMVDSLRGLGCEVVTRPWGQEKSRESLLARLARGTRDLMAIGKALRAAQFDVLFINTAHDIRGFARDIPLLLMARYLGQQKATILFHGSQAERLLDHQQRLLRFVTAWMLRLSASVFLLSSEEERAWRQFYPHTHYHVVRLPIVPGPRNPECGPARLTISCDLPLLLFVGRVIKEKGVLDLVEAMPLVLSELGCRLLIAGDGAARSAAERRVRELALNHAVTFAGYLHGAALQQAYRLASVLVLPTYFPEGFPLVVIEAMEVGVPIITTHIRGVADWLEEPRNALFVPIRDPQVLAHRIVELLSDQSLMASMRTANRELSKAFGPLDVASEWHDALVEIVGFK